LTKSLLYHCGPLIAFYQKAETALNHHNYDIDDFVYCGAILGALLFPNLWLNPPESKDSLPLSFRLMLPFDVMFPYLYLYSRCHVNRKRCTIL